MSTRKRIFIYLAAAVSASLLFAGGAAAQLSGYGLSTQSFFQLAANVVAPLSPNHAVGVQMQPPQNATSSLQSGGTLASSTTYYYVVTAKDGAGGETLASSEVSRTSTSTTNTVRVSWDAVTGAVGYNVYRATSSQAYSATSTATSSIVATTFDDTGVTLTAGQPPSAGTAYYSKVSSSTDSWFVGGQVGVGTSSPAVQLHVTKPSGTSSVGIGSAGAPGRLCLYNGSSFTVLQFSAGTTTPAYSTSTTCNEN